MFIEGKESTLNPTEISDRMRNIREIQSVGSKLSAASDDTFDVIKNYIKSNFWKQKQCIHTINVETGELASVSCVANSCPVTTYFFFFLQKHGGLSVSLPLNLLLPGTGY